MAKPSQESDWKIFRELHKVALERFCERALAEVDAIRRDDSQSYHERYVQIYRLIQEQDQQLAQAFNQPRRSQMRLQLYLIYSYGLFQPDEISRFSSDLQNNLRA